MDIINKYENLVEKGIYPDKKEWFFKYGYHGSDYEKLLNYKKKSLYNISLPSTEKSIYFNMKIVVNKLREFNELYMTAELDSFLDHFDEIMIFSEVEGSLSIEGIKTSRKKINNALQKDDDLNTIEQIIVNMMNGIKFIMKNDITSKNINNLYNILSNKALNEDEKIEGLYRKKNVEIIDKFGQVSDSGVPPENLNTYMNELIKLINKQKETLNELTYLMPHIIHYYIIYLHPYYDFNGRTARMLSYWYMLNDSNIQYKLPIYSEAINYNQSTKQKYYKSIESSRENDNDLTYFILYIIEVSTLFLNTYNNLSLFNQNASKDGYIISDSENGILKSILLYRKENEMFNWEDVKKFDKKQFSKQYYLKILGSLVDKKVLKLTKKGKSNFYELKFR